LMLNTGWDTSAHQLYGELGFREIRRDPWSDGVLMGRTVNELPMSDWMDAYFGSTDAVKVVQLDPRHWAPLMIVCNQRYPHLVRHYALGILGDWAVDGRLLNLFEVLETGRGCAVALQTSAGAVVGFATLMPTLGHWQIASYQRHIQLIDVWIHPNFAAHTKQLLHELLTWSRPTNEEVEHLMAYVEVERTDLREALEQENFDRIASLEQHYKLGDGRMVDLMIYRRESD